ncbi:HD domain [Trinorchestia longiramus]|nr:HD domain [Trinorchestia longiramus]
MRASKKYIDFLSEVSKLKHLDRTGWVLHKVPKPETVSGHMYRMAIAAMTLDHTDNVDTNKVLRMCLVHDLAECQVGDITPQCGVSEQEKHSREMASMQFLTGLISPAVGIDMLNLFKEYEDQSTPESQLVKDLDKFDMILQAFEYEVAYNKPRWLEEFFQSTEGKFKHPRVVGWVEDLYKRRQEFISKAEVPDVPSDCSAAELGHSET